MNRAQRDAIGSHHRIMANLVDCTTGCGIMLWPRHLQHLMLAILLAHLLHTADVIDMRVGQHNSIDVVGMEEFLERASEQIDPNRNALPRIEKERTAAGTD